MKVTSALLSNLHSLSHDFEFEIELLCAYCQTCSFKACAPTFEMLSIAVGAHRCKFKARSVQGAVANDKKESA